MLLYESSPTRASSGIGAPPRRLVIGGGTCGSRLLLRRGLCGQGGGGGGGGGGAGPARGGGPGAGGGAGRREVRCAAALSCSGELPSNFSSTPKRSARCETVSPKEKDLS